MIWNCQTLKENAGFQTLEGELLPVFLGGAASRIGSPHVVITGRLNNSRTIPQHKPIERDWANNCESGKPFYVPLIVIAGEASTQPVPERPQRVYRKPD